LPIVDVTPSRPARDFVEAEERFAALCRLDEDPLIAWWGRSRAFLHGSRTPLAVVLVHGFTNSPQQFVALAETLESRGHNVIVPRLPGHGDADRKGTRLAGARVEQWLATVEESLDIASGLGERIAVAGISAAATIASWFALSRRKIAHAVAVAPMFGILRLPALVDELLLPALLWLPDFQMRWDPFGDGRQIPSHAYPRFPTRGLAQCLRVGLDVYTRSPRESPRSRVTLILNERDPAVNNALAEEIAGRWRAHGANALTLSDLPAIHDIIDPANPYQRTDLVYPPLIDALES
jgi:alpha-beta hydrolase superfamily lysophospholipase